jgi:guanine deaminase
MPLDDDHWMKEAFRLAEINVLHGQGGPFGAIIVKDGKKVSEGTNLVSNLNDPTAHAEMIAIRSACKALDTFRLDGCVLYTSCYPCPMCFGALYWAHLERVVYGNTKKDAAEIHFDDAFIYQELVLSDEKRNIPFCHFDSPEAIKAFRIWEQKDNKIHY